MPMSHRFRRPTSPVSWIAVAFVAAALPAAAGAGEEDAATPLEVQRVGPPTMYMPDIERYSRYQQRPPETRYPIPQPRVTRDTYFQWLEDSGHFAYADNAETHGKYAPRHLMPVLAKYVQSGNRRYGEACIAGLKSFHQAMKAEVNEKGWHSFFIDEPVYLGLYARYLKKGGLLDAQKDAWFRDMVLYMNRNVHVWGTEPTYWRGPMHRAQDEGIMKGLAARWYPDAPEAGVWRDYSQTVFQDWWRYRDFPPNDTGYLFAIIMPHILNAELIGNETLFTDPEARKTWDRLWQEVSPDGIVSPYGAHGGFNATAGTRIMLLEILAAHTGDGRYRYVAHRLMNYLRYQQHDFLRQHILAGPETTEKLSVAYLLADDSIAPVAPDGGSQIDYRKETLRLRNHRDKRMSGRFLGEDARLDPDPEKANICCGLLVTEKAMPSKLIFRSGWKPGDFFVLVDLFPRHDPLNVPGILGITRWGAGLTCTISAKGDSDENRLMIRPLDDKPPRRPNTDPDLSDPYYQEVEVKDFSDCEDATFATVVVSNYQGFPVRHTREFIFVKNRFLVCRDSATFEEGFRAEVGPVFNTQNIGPQIGSHWANTFMSAPSASDICINNPPVDLLVYFAPQPECRMQVVDRTAADPRTVSVPAQLRYVRQGDMAPGSTVHFTQVYYPHPPRLKLPKSNAAGDSRNRGMLGEDDAASIETLRDDADVTVLRLRLDDGRTEYVVFNPKGSKVEIDGLSIDARALYLDRVKDEVSRSSAASDTQSR